MEAWGTGEIELNVTESLIKKEWHLGSTVVSSGLLGSRASWADGRLGGSTCREKFPPQGQS